VFFRKPNETKKKRKRNRKKKTAQQKKDPKEKGTETKKSKRNRKKMKKKTHPVGWSASAHYGYGKCGQSCPCCRSLLEPAGAVGTCLVCSHGVRDGDERDLTD
jgi:hypothetical protein